MSDDNTNESPTKLLKNETKDAKSELIQLHIDAGQKDFGSKTCPGCGMGFHLLIMHFSLLPWNNWWYYSFAVS